MSMAASLGTTEPFSTLACARSAAVLLDQVLRSRDETLGARPLHTLANPTTAKRRNTTAATHRPAESQPSTRKPVPVQSSAIAASRIGASKGHCGALGAVIGILSVWGEAMRPGEDRWIST
jgi:hypothetical protein